MSRRGNCFDNAPIESFWGTLKSELVYHRRFATRQQAQQEITMCDSQTSFHFRGGRFLTVLELAAPVGGASSSTRR
ncbi:hypothetical protein PTKU46_86190 [Paraburkholderia terrae]